MHQSFKILPGVDQTKTPALNEAAVSVSQLIRFMPDRTLGGIIQKLGGWTKYVATSLNSICRALWAWEDTNSNSYLAAGCLGTVGGGSLQVITGGGASDISPRSANFSVAVRFTTTLGSNAVTVKITGATLDSFCAINIKTQVSVGGLILFGLYQCTGTGTADTVIIYATDALGAPAYATSAVAAGGIVPKYDVTSSSSTVLVTLPDHGFVTGDTFAALIATTLGGITIYGNYRITNVLTANTFEILATTTSGSAGPYTAYENSGNAYFTIYSSVGPTVVGAGYGGGPYGVGAYGTGASYNFPSGTPITAVDWTLDNWGEILVANPYGGPIFLWQPTSGFQTSYIIPTAPPVNNGAFVAMPQRQIIAWGSTETGIVDPLLVRWSDVDNFDQWIPLLTNQAGSYRIPKGSRIVQGIQGPQQGLIWTDLGLWAMQYVGPNDVYNFNELGNGCGLIGRKAAGSMNGTVYWMGQSQFFRLAGGVEPIKCPVWDVAFQDLDKNNTENIRFAANSRFGEVAWYYPVAGGNGENTNYVKYNVLLDQWDYGTLSRTAWINESVLGPPSGAGPDYYLYQHETSYDADGAPMTSYFQTGYFVITEADYKMFIDQVWPDMKWGYYGNVNQAANVLLTFYVTDYPGQTPTAYGPYTLTQATTYITPRFRGRLVSIKVESNDIGTWWRLGNIRYRVQQDGKY